MKTRTALTTIWLIIFIFLMYETLAFTTLSPGTCLTLPNSTTICSSIVLCSSVKTNVTCNPSAVRCQYNLTCPAAIVNISNRVNATWIQKPLISRTFFSDNQVPILVGVVGILGIVAWRKGWLKSGFKQIGENYQQDYYGAKDRVTQTARDLKDTTADFTELK